MCVLGEGGVAMDEGDLLQKGFITISGKTFPSVLPFQNDKDEDRRQRTETGGRERRLLGSLRFDLKVGATTSSSSSFFLFFFVKLFNSYSYKIIYEWPPR